MSEGDEQHTDEGEGPAVAGGSVRRRAGVAGGILLLGLLVLVVAGDWWPWVLLVVGVSAASDRLLDGRFRQALAVLVVALLVTVPMAWMSDDSIPMAWIVSFVLIAIGVASIVKALTPRSV